MSGEDRRRHEFEGFSLDAEKKVLWRDGEIVSLPPKAVEMLVVLLKNRGEVVTKDELLREVWGDAFVEESVLTNNIYLLRKILKEKTGAKNLIQTVPRRGYRFGAKTEKDGEFVLEHHIFEQTLIEDVSDVQSFSALETKQTPAVSKFTANNQSATDRQISTRPMYLYAAAFLIALLSIGAAVWKLSQATAEITLAEIKSIAVLPLKSFDAQTDDENLRLRLTDSLITKLGSLDSIEVRPTNAVLPFVNTKKDASEIGKLLGVETVLDGRIQYEGEKIRVTLQLVSTKDGAYIWSEQFDGQADKLLDLQDSISVKLLTDINLPLTPEQSLAFAKRPTENADAFENYLKGRYFWQKRNHESLQKAIVFYEKAIAADPDFAEAYVGLADSYYLLVDYNYDTSTANVARAKENLLKALALDPNLAAAHVTLGLIETSYEWNWQSAEQSLLRAIRLAPNSPDAHHRYAMLLLKLRRFAEAEGEIRRAKELDPLSLGINMNLGAVLFFSKRFDEAVKQLQKTIELDSDFAAPRWYLARCYWAKGEKSASLTENVRALRTEGNVELADQIEQQMTVLEPEKVVGNLAEEWARQLNPTGINQHDLAILAAYQNNREEVLRRLEKLVALRHPWSASINAEPEFDFVRGEPQFQAILQKLNFF